MILKGSTFHQLLTYVTLHRIEPKWCTIGARVRIVKCGCEAVGK